MSVHEHVCQFFDTDESRGEAVAAYVAEGIGRGDRVLVVARPLYWAAITDHLQATHGVSAEGETARGFLVVKDAMDTLRRLTRNGTPDAAAFFETVGTPVRGLAELGPLRAYGEMVDILAQRGDVEDAVALEGLWNKLARATPITLMCGYSAAHFVAPSTHRAMRDICAAHTDLRRSEHDTLADWLLTAAHHPFGSSANLSH